jgi:hypothetical protein
MPEQPTNEDRGIDEDFENRTDLDSIIPPAPVMPYFIKPKKITDKCEHKIDKLCKTHGKECGYLTCADCGTILYLGNHPESPITEKTMLGYCERCNSELPEHLCEQCGQTTCQTCFQKDCIMMKEDNEIMSKLFDLRQHARTLYRDFKKHGFDILYYEGYESGDIIPRWYTSYAWILSKNKVNFEFHMSSSQLSNRSKIEVSIWTGTIPNLLVSQERMDFLHWDKVRVLS